MQDNTIYEFKDVLIDGNKYFVNLHDLKIHDWVCDVNDIYGYGKNECVITDISFTAVIIHLYGGEIEVLPDNEDWKSVAKQVTNHIFEDVDFMQDWQNREFKND
jgi:hypothetical protein